MVNAATSIFSLPICLGHFRLPVISRRSLSKRYLLHALNIVTGIITGSCSRLLVRGSLVGVPSAIDCPPSTVGRRPVSRNKLGDCSSRRETAKPCMKYKDAEMTGAHGCYKISLNKEKSTVDCRTRRPIIQETAPWEKKSDRGLDTSSLRKNERSKLYDGEQYRTLTQ